MGSASPPASPGSRPDPGTLAGRQAAALFGLAGVLAIYGATMPVPGPGTLRVVAAADLAVAVAAWWLPWQRWGRYATLTLALPAFAVLALATWAVGGRVTGTGPFFVLVYAWLGLHHPRWTLVAVAPVGVLAYVVPLVVTGQPPDVIATAVVLIPVATAVGWVIADRVRRLELARETIRRNNDWRASMMATLAHDVRAPLASIEMALELLDQYADAMSGPERRALLGPALRQAGRIKRLATDLLDLRRVEGGRLVLDRQPVAVGEAVAEAVEFVGPAVAAEVTVKVDGSLRVTADPQRLQQVLVNLLANAVRHGQAPVIVDAHRDADVVRLAVRDHGKGVPDELLPRLFEQFGAGGGDPTGIGLGLWIAHQLAVAHGGRLHYEPANPGARFILILPAA